MTAYLNKPTDVVVKLTSQSYGPAGIADVAFTHVYVHVRRPGEDDFATKAVTAEDWVELGEGFYVLKFLAADVGPLPGELFYRIGPNGYTEFDETTGRVDVEFPTINALIAPDTCLVHGNIVDLGGEHGTESEIVWRLAKTPSSAGSSLVEGRLLRTIPDAFGNFSIALLRGKKVVVTVAKAGLQHTITVPDLETADLIDILPPITD